MVNKPKKSIVRQQSTSDDYVKKRSGKPKGIKQNKLPPSGEWCEITFLKELIIYLTIIGRFNNLHKTGTQSKQFDKSEQKTKQKNQIRKRLSDICGRFQKSDGTIVFFFNTKCEQQNLEQVFQEINFYEINRTLIEKLGQMLELRFINEMIHFIKQGQDQNFQIFQFGGLENQSQVVQAYFVNYFLTKYENDFEDIDIQQEFEEFIMGGVNQTKIIEIYKKIASYFLNQQNSYDCEQNKILEQYSYNEDSQDYGKQFQLE